MMKANELRIGNKVHFQRNASTTEVVTIAWIGDDSAGYKEEHEASYPHSLQYYSGIPLTPEWLERMGAKSNTINHRWEFHRNDEVYVLRLYKEGFSMGIEIEKNERFADKSFTYGIQYVHQLQNLYFALTGEELTIKDA